MKDNSGDVGEITMSKLVPARALVLMAVLVIALLLAYGHISTKELQVATVEPTLTISVEPTITPTQAEPASTLPPLPTPAPLSEGRIAFTSDRHGSRDIYVMNADGTDPHRLTDDPTWDRAPAWSPDSRFIAFYSGHTVYVINADGSGQYYLESGGWWACPSPPSWSPDGRHIAFYDDRGGQHIDDIYVVDADGSNLRRLTHQGGMAPEWSPDGSSILYACSGSPWAICKINADGSNQHQIINMAIDHCNWDKDFALSPDGRSIAFSYYDHQAGSSEVYIMDVDGSNRRNISQNPAADGHPTWSPGGGFIAFTSDRDGNREIYVMNADGSNQRNITQNPADDTDPAWAP